jgi:hypothetical protein
MLPSSHDLVTAALIYLSIGAVLWMVLDALGIIQTGLFARASAGIPSSGGAIVLATLMMIVLWPAFVWWWIKGMRGTTTK